MSAEEIFAQRMRLGRLFDIYGGLLTAKQKQCLGLYFYDDLSLSEISEELGVSRQAVHDLLKRVEQLLERYEASLKVLSREESCMLSCSRQLICWKLRMRQKKTRPCKCRKSFAVKVGR